MPLGFNFKRTHRYNVSAKDLSVIPIFTLDYSCIEYTISSTTTGKDALEFVAQRLELNEICYFGFKYESKDNQMRWLILTKPIKKQLERFAGNVALYLGIMLYIDNPQFLPDQKLRRQFYLQLRSDISNGLISITSKSAIKLSAYSLQADYGDFIDVESTMSRWRESPPIDVSILSGAEDLATTQHSDDIIWGYCHLRGVSHENAIWYYLDELKTIPTYYVQKFTVLSDEGVQTSLAVSRNGLNITTCVFDTTKSNFLKWQDIKDLKYTKKSFNIQLVKDSKQVQIIFKSSDNSSYLWHFCVQIHNAYIAYWTKMKLSPHRTSLPIDETPLTRLRHGSLSADEMIIQADINEHFGNCDKNSFNADEIKDDVIQANGYFTDSPQDVNLKNKHLPPISDGKSKGFKKHLIPSRKDNGSFKRLASLFNSPSLGVRNKVMCSDDSSDTVLSDSAGDNAVKNLPANLEIPKSPSYRPLSTRSQKKFFRRNADSDESYSSESISDNDPSVVSLSDERKSKAYLKNYHLNSNRPIQHYRPNEEQTKYINRMNNQSSPNQSSRASTFLGHFTPPAFRKFIKSAKKISSIFGTSTNNLVATENEPKRAEQLVSNNTSEDFTVVDRKSENEVQVRDEISSPVMKRRSFEKIIAENSLRDNYNNFKNNSSQLREIQTFSNFLEKPKIFLQPPSPMSSNSNSQSLEWVLSSKPLRMIEKYQKSEYEVPKVQNATELSERDSSTSTSEMLPTDDWKVNLSSSGITIGPGQSFDSTPPVSTSEKRVESPAKPAETNTTLEKSCDNSISESNVTKLLTMLNIQETALAHRLLSDYQLNLFSASRKESIDADDQESTNKVKLSNEAKEMNLGALSKTELLNAIASNSLQSLISESFDESNYPDFFSNKNARLTLPMRRILHNHFYSQFKHQNSLNETSPREVKEERDGTFRQTLATLINSGRLNELNDLQYFTLPKYIHKKKCNQDQYDYPPNQEFGKITEQPFSMLSSVTTSDNDSNSTFHILTDSTSGKSRSKTNGHPEKLVKTDSSDLTESSIKTSSNDSKMTNLAIPSKEFMAQFNNLITKLSIPTTSSLIKSLLLEHKNNFEEPQKDSNCGNDPTNNSQKWNNYDDQTSEITGHLTTFESNESDGEYENLTMLPYIEEIAIETMHRDSVYMPAEINDNEILYEPPSGPPNEHDTDSQSSLEMLQQSNSESNATSTNCNFENQNVTDANKGMNSNYMTPNFGANLDEDFIAFIRNERSNIEADKKQLSKEILTIMEDYAEKIISAHQQSKEESIKTGKINNVLDNIPLEPPKKSSSLLYFPKYDASKQPIYTRPEVNGEASLNLSTPEMGEQDISSSTTKPKAVNHHSTVKINPMQPSAGGQRNSVKANESKKTFVRLDLQMKPNF